MKIGLDFNDVRIGDTFTLADDALDSATWSYVVREMRKRGQMPVLAAVQNKSGKRFEVRGAPRLKVVA
jgi:hypothetical protein